MSALEIIGFIVLVIIVVGIVVAYGEYNRRVSDIQTNNPIINPITNPGNNQVNTPTPTSPNYYIPASPGMTPTSTNVTPITTPVVPSNSANIESNQAVIESGHVTITPAKPEVVPNPIITPAAPVIVPIVKPITPITPITPVVTAPIIKPITPPVVTTPVVTTVANTPTSDDITEFVSNINAIRSSIKSKPLTWNNNISPLVISKVNSCLYNKNAITYNGATLGQVIFEGNTTDISTVISKFAANSADFTILTNPKYTGIACANNPTCNYTVCLFS
jgi:hypothetical protein